MQKVHHMLGYAGLLPFIGLAAAMVYGVKEAEFLLVTYAALIVSFLGGIVWMVSLSSEKHRLWAVTSNLAMLLAWVCVILREINVTLPLIAILLLVLQLLESRLLGDVFAQEYRTMRRRLTLIASISLFSAYLLA